MKLHHFAASAAVLLVLPVICCSCNSGKNTAKPETETPEAVEVKPESPKTEPESTKAEPASEVKQEPAAPAKAEPAPEVKQEPAAPAKAEPAPEVKQEPVLVPETKKEPAPAKTAPAPKAEKAALPCEHMVRTGDNLWKLSLRYYGTGTKWKQIQEANKDKLKKADHLEPGTVLTIPAAK